MNCPHCQHELTPYQLGSTVYWSCASCHLLWFDNKENDFLTLAESEMLLDKYPKKTLIGVGIHCPRCNEPMYKDTYYFRCSTCGGVLATASQILEEKKAKAKQFVASRPLTLTQVRSLVILGAVFVFFGINYVMLSTLKHKTTIQSQAAELATNIHIRNVNDSQKALFFATEIPYRATAHFYNQNTQWSVVINDTPQIDHFLVFDTPQKGTTLTVILSDGTGKTVSTNELRFDALQ